MAEKRPREALQTGKGCWYLIHTPECALCGAGKEWRERRWGPKPERAEDRYDYQQFACSSHFL